MKIKALTLLALLVSSTAHAGDPPKGPSEKLEFSAALAIGIPMFASIGLVGSAVGGVSNAIDASSRGHAGSRPPMKIKAVRTQPDGGRQVELIDPEAIGAEPATLTWPRQESDPAEAFVVDDTVAFEVSPGGAGWLVRNEGGNVLTFVPTAESAEHARSARWE